MVSALDSGSRGPGSNTGRVIVLRSCMYNFIYPRVDEAV